MSTPRKLNKTTRAALAAQFSAGAAKHFPSGIQLPVGGVTLTLPQIQAQLQGYASMRAEVETTHAAYRAKVAAEDHASPSIDTFIGAFEKVVRGSFGNQADVLKDFGLAPEKARAPLTVEEKAAAAAKRASTRAARGTRGSKAKLAIHGDVTGVVVTPVTAPQPAAPASPPANAPAGTGPTGNGPAAPATPAHS
jgi:hypothetical protein